jgi:hypothetical protein
MQSNTVEIVLFEIIQEQQRMICNLGRNDLVFIELSRASGVSPEVLAAAAQTILSTLHSVDALSDRIHALAVEARRS